jgi:hypothetical protein
VTYTPAPNYNGTDSFTYTISDGNGGTDTATVRLTVTPVNDPPVAVNDSFTTSKNKKLTTSSVLANDTDLDGDSLTIRSYSSSSAKGGSVSSAGDGKFTYTPKNNFTGTDTFTYVVSDGNGGTDTGTVTITVTAANSPPVASNDYVSTPKNTKVTTDNLLLNDDDPNGDPFGVSSFTATSAKGGTVTYLGNGRFTYTPKNNFTGTDTFTYTITDASGGSDTATVTVTVRSCNDNDYDYDDDHHNRNYTYLPRVSATFCGKWVTACSTKDLSNCVLRFSDDSRQKFDGLSGGSRTLCGTGANEGKKIVGIWIKSGNNSSSDGPGYGEYVSCQ